MGTKLDLPQIKRGAAGTPGPRIIKPPSTPTPMSRGATPLPPENNGFLQVPSTPTPGSRPEEVCKFRKVTGYGFEVIIENVINRIGVSVLQFAKGLYLKML